MALLNLFFTFFRVGLFTIGGGLVAIPILQGFVRQYQWIEESLFIDMIALSQSTPGPIGVNMATFVGYSQFGLIGTLVATTGMVLPSLIIIYFVAKFLKAYQSNVYVKEVLSGVRPVVVGLIVGAAIIIAEVSFNKKEAPIDIGNLLDTIDISKVVFFAIILFFILKFKKHPIIYLSIGALVGMILY